ncbi:uncharacterized protein [Miscanthus floridulus]|uniref:uncharacterized protein n=1 Tax=Miscanthus floridulus TaxID=154761 RepID=UPI0034574C86
MSDILIKFLSSPSSSEDDLPAHQSSEEDVSSDDWMPSNYSSPWTSEKEDPEEEDEDEEDDTDADADADDNDDSDSNSDFDSLPPKRASVGLDYGPRVHLYIWKLKAEANVTTNEEHLQEEEEIMPQFTCLDLTSASVSPQPSRHLLPSRAAVASLASPSPSSRTPLQPRRATTPAQPRATTPAQPCASVPLSRATTGPSQPSAAELRPCLASAQCLAGLLAP